MPRLAAGPPPYDARTLATVAALCAALLLPPIVAYELVWEVAAALGYAACAAAIAVFAVPPAPRRFLTPYRFSVHRVAGNALLTLAVLHVAVMVALDPFMLDYLGWMMPLHVLLGVLALLALLLAAATREPWAAPPPAAARGAALPRLERDRRRRAPGRARADVLLPPDRAVAHGPGRRRLGPAASGRSRGTPRPPAHCLGRRAVLGRARGPDPAAGALGDLRPAGRQSQHWLVGLCRPYYG